MIQEKPYAYLKRIAPGPPAQYTAYVGINMPANYKIGNVKDNQHTGATPPPEEHSISVVLIADSTSPTPNYVDSAEITFNTTAAQTYVRLYLVDDTPQGMGATTGTISVRLQDAD